MLCSTMPGCLRGLQMDMMISKPKDILYYTLSVGLYWARIDSSEIASEQS